MPNFPFFLLFFYRSLILVRRYRIKSAAILLSLACSNSSTTTSTNATHGYLEEEYKKRERQINSISKSKGRKQQPTRQVQTISVPFPPKHYDDVSSLLGIFQDYSLAQDLWQRAESNLKLHIESINIAEICDSNRGKCGSDRGCDRYHEGLDFRQCPDGKRLPEYPDAIFPQEVWAYVRFFFPPEKFAGITEGPQQAGPQK